ncbi:MAG: nucleoside hydrolase-like domain-containing protein [Bdellovibrionota bacterium]
MIDGKSFAAESGSGVSHNGMRFENQSIALSPATDAARAQMIRSSIYSKTPNVSVPVANGSYRIYVYNWEDTVTGTFNLGLEGVSVATGLSTGAPGSWRRLGPYIATVSDGALTLTGTGSVAINLSSIEIYSVSGGTATPTPTPTPAPSPTPSPTPVSTGSRLPMIITTDISVSEPDDKQSLIRALLYSNEVDIKLIVATTSMFRKTSLYPSIIREVITGYGDVRTNLVLHGGSSYPTTTTLNSRVSVHLPVYGMLGVGAGKDSDSTNKIISIVDSSSVPVAVGIWGGSNALAQALYKVRATRTASAVDQFVSKLRVYQIAVQDDSGPWLEANFPKMHYIVSKTVWKGISGDKHDGGFPGGDFKLVSDLINGQSWGYWLEYNVRRTGRFGSIYPPTKYKMEGDTPSFLHFLKLGLNDSFDPTLGGWGGRFVRVTGTNRFTDTSDTVEGQGQYVGTMYTQPYATIWRWREAYQHDFKARMLWTVNSTFSGANHPPVVSGGGTLNAARGQVVSLMASAQDPDGDALSYKWFNYKEAGGHSSVVSVQNATSRTASFVAPSVTVPTKLHFIVQVTDDGSPRLTRYQRVIVNVSP